MIRLCTLLLHAVAAPAAATVRLPANPAAYDGARMCTPEHPQASLHAWSSGR